MREIIKLLMWTLVFLGALWLGIYAIGIFLGILAYAVLAPQYFIATLLFLVVGTWCTMKLGKWLIKKL